MAIAVHALAQCLLMKRELLVWLSGLGRTATGALQCGNGLLSNDSLLLPAEPAKKRGLRKPRMEVIVSSFRKKRLGSSQPIMAARLVLIRSLYNPCPSTASTL